MLDGWGTRRFMCTERESTPARNPPVLQRVPMPEPCGKLLGAHAQAAATDTLVIVCPYVELERESTPTSNRLLFGVSLRNMDELCIACFRAYVHSYACMAMRPCTERQSGRQQETVLFRDIRNSASEPSGGPSWVHALFCTACVDEYMPKYIPGM